MIIWLLICLVIKKINAVVNGLFTRGRKLNISLAFIGQTYFPHSKKLSLNSTRYFIMKTPNKWELQEISFNHQWDIDFEDFMNL